MKVKFIEISPDEVKDGFPEFYTDEKVFFEIMKDSKPIGFYGIKDLGDDIGEISLYINEGDRKNLSKKITDKILTFPSDLGFKKVLIWTEIKSVERFLKKMSKVGVKYLFEKENLHWFEVNYGVC